MLPGVHAVLRAGAVQTWSNACMLLYTYPALVIRNMVTLVLHTQKPCTAWVSAG